MRLKSTVAQLVLPGLLDSPIHYSVAGASAWLSVTLACHSASGLQLVGPYLFLQTLGDLVAEPVCVAQAGRSPMLLTLAASLLECATHWAHWHHIVAPPPAVHHLASCGLSAHARLSRGASAK